MSGQRSSAVPLAWLYAGLIVYASLNPFVGWRLPGVSPLSFLGRGWWPWWTGFDLVSNLLGYLPFGALLFVAQVRSGSRIALAAWRAVLAAALLSLAMETLQNYLPTRIPSNVDLALNTLGAGFGVALAAIAHLSGGIGRWQAARERWFITRSAGGLTLLCLWPVALLFPTAVPFGIGHVLDRLQDGLVLLLEGTPAQAWTDGWSAAQPAAAAFSPASEIALMTLGLLAPCLVAYTITRPGWRRLLLVAGAAAIGTATITLSTALNFGPDHAFAWFTPRTPAALFAGVAAAALLGRLPRRLCAGLGLIALTALVMLATRAPADPYFAQSLQSWEQGRFIRFHGAAQWVGWAWPYAALAYLLARLGAREPAVPPVPAATSAPASRMPA
jgi:VanZ family protein